MNLELSTRHTVAALDELVTNSLVYIEQRRRNKKSTEHLYHYLENAPVSIDWLRNQINEGIAAAGSYDGWMKDKFHSMHINAKMPLMRDFFARINGALHAINLLVALEGLRKKYATERKELLKYYHLGFKLLKKDKDYALLFPTVRHDLIKGRDIPHGPQELDSVIANVDPRLGERLPGHICVCNHAIEDHIISPLSSKCEEYECACTTFSPKMYIGRRKEKKD